MNYDEEAPETCSDSGKVTKGTLPAGDLPLKYNDVLIVATSKAFLFSLPLGGFVQAMTKKKLKVAVSTTRKEGWCGVLVFAGASATRCCLHTSKPILSLGLVLKCMC